MGLFGSSQACGKCGKKNCADMSHVNNAPPPPPDGPGRLRPGGSESLQDISYESNKTRQDNEGKAHLVRHLTPEDIRNGVLLAMLKAGAVDRSNFGYSENHRGYKGQAVKVVLKKRFANRWREFEA